MTTEDGLNEFIENYLKNDKSQRALMLTAPWGTGKSFYVKNSLCPFLKSKKIDFAIVSLYGITDIRDISKNIYLEIRTKKIASKKSEKANVTWIIGKTIAKGVAGYFNVDLNQSDDDWQRLYESIDLTNKLIILEDLERSNLDIIEVMGFINNLVEQDGTKVLIIANENEIIKYKEISNPDGKKTTVLDRQSEEYLRIKEKTIGDTIHFNANVFKTIENIIRSFNNALFDKMLEEKDDNGDSSFVRRIYQQMLGLKCFNFRSLLYGTQKVHEVICKFNHDFNLEFIQNVFIGTIAYCINIGNGSSKDWDSETNISQNLGTYAYPFYKVMYEYIVHHEFDEKSFDEMEQIFLISKNFGETDEKLKVLFNYYVSTEKDLESTINYISSCLKTDNGISHDEYSKIANYLISVKYEVGFEDEIDECLKLMLDNAKEGIDNGQKISTFIRSGLQLSTNEQAQELQNFIKEIDEYQKNSKGVLHGFTYEPNDLCLFYDSILKNNRTFIKENGFANKLDSSQLLSMIEKSSAMQIETLRSIFHFVYFSFINVKDYFSCDLAVIKEIKESLNSLDDSDLDKIQRLQLNWFNNDLEEIINKLEN